VHNSTLAWQGCFNVRDLGGLPTAGGGRTRRGAVVRADLVEGLTESGWSDLAGYGVRTVVDLRNHDEVGGDCAPRPDGLETVHLPLDDIDDTEFWGNRWYDDPEYATPLYYRAHLERFPTRSARVIAAIARARPGGVLFHCVRGRDRTGQIAMLVLALAGVAPEDVAADYCISNDCLPNREADEFLSRAGTSAAEAIMSTLASLDVPAQLRRGGLTDDDLERLRARLS
jgi:protein tyrosine/serine phosphatase